MFNKNKKKVNKTKLSYFLELYITMQLIFGSCEYKVVAKNR